MNDAYQDFIQHFVEIDDNQIKVYAEAAEQFWSEIEKKAAELEITVEYYVMEFM
jgi:hypothetical protein